MAAAEAPPQAGGESKPKAEPAGGGGQAEGKASKASKPGKPPPPPGPRDTGIQYDYKSVRDLVFGAAQTTVGNSLYGVITSFNTPRDTRGTDMSMSLVVTDALGGDTGAGGSGDATGPCELVINLFAPTPDQLPQVRSIGDVIRIHRIKVQQFARSGDAPRAQGVGKIGKPTHFCTWTADGGEAPYQTSSAGYTWNALDAKALRSLQASTEREDAPQGLKEAHQGDYARTLQDITARMPEDKAKGAVYIDGVFKVVHEERVPAPQTPLADTQTQTQPHETGAGAHGQEQDQQAPQGAADGRMMLVQYLWDGTDCTPCTSRDGGALAGIEGGVTASRADSLGRDVLRDLPSMGSVVPMLWEPYGNDAADRAHTPAPVGSWVSVRHVKSIVGKGYRRELVLKRYSHMAPFTQAIAANLESGHADRVGGARRGEMQAVCPWALPPRGKALSKVLAARQGTAFSTLRQVALSSSPTGAFRVVARVVDVAPRQVENFCARAPPRTGDKRHAPSGGGASADGAAPPRHAYRVKLLLEDATGRVSAWLQGEQAEKFFAGLPPCDLAQNTASARQLRGVVDLLVGAAALSEAGRPLFPWVECCLVSHYTDRARPWDTRRYQVVDTVFTGAAAAGGG